MGKIPNKQTLTHTCSNTCTKSHTIIKTCGNSFSYYDNDLTTLRPYSAVCGTHIIRHIFQEVCLSFCGKRVIRRLEEGFAKPSTFMITCFGVYCPVERERLAVQRVSRGHGLGGQGGGQSGGQSSWQPVSRDGGWMVL